MTKLNLCSGALVLDGFINYDLRKNRGYENYVAGWDWRNGLTDHKDNSVDAVTCSCCLLEFRLEEYPKLFSEVFRVLKPDGIFRLTEEDNHLPEKFKKMYHMPWSSFRVISEPTFKNVKQALGLVGFKEVTLMDKETTNWKDKSLIQDWHKAGTHEYGEVVKGRVKYFDVEAKK